MNQAFNDLAQQLIEWQKQGMQRQFPNLIHQGKWVTVNQRKMLNLSSNDYLGLTNNTALQIEFLAQYKKLPFSSSSSRLLTGNFSIYSTLETTMASAFQREACLLFNSGYHANIGILPALATKKTLILADKLIHASLIDGIRLSAATFIRYRHNDYLHLESLLVQYAQDYERIIIVTESLFSMDGDFADLKQLVAFKQRFDNVILYVDEAHAIGVYGKNGLGYAEQCDCLAQIDLLIGTFGKALASMGAYLICDDVIKQYLTHRMRPLIYSTALPPINVAWSYFIFQKLTALQSKREHLHLLSAHLRESLAKQGKLMASQSNIVPYIIGDNLNTLEKAKQLQEAGFYCLPIRPPTVPQGTSRIRFSLNAEITFDELQKLIQIL